MSSASSLRAKAFGSTAPDAPGAKPAGPTKPAPKGAQTARKKTVKPDAGGQPAGLRVRLRDWWHGYETDEPEPEAETPAEHAAAVEEAEPETPPEQMRDSAAWSTVRAQAAEIVVGDDCRTPIGPDIAVEALKPLGLSSANTVLDISAGLGNAARQISRDYGCWVSGLEGSACLAELGMARSVEAGMAKKAPIAHADLEELVKPEKTFDCVYGREAFYTVKNKSALLETLVEALKPGGELVFTDYMLRAPDLKSTVIAEWLSGEPLQAHVWTLDEMVALLRELHLDVRVAEDYSKAFRDLIVRRLELLVTKNELVASDPVQAEHLLHEVELWGRRVKALDGGDVQVYRIYARKSAGNGKIRTMSNW